MKSFIQGGIDDVPVVLGAGVGPDIDGDRLHTPGVTAICGRGRGYTSSQETKWRSRRLTAAGIDVGSRLIAS